MTENTCDESAVSLLVSFRDDERLVIISYLDICAIGTLISHYSTSSVLFLFTCLQSQDRKHSSFVQKYSENPETVVRRVSWRSLEELCINILLAVKVSRLQADVSAATQNDNAEKSFCA